jgi:hypothetical protein
MLIRPQSLEIFRVVSYEEELQTVRLFMLLRPAKPFFGLAVDLAASTQSFHMKTRVRELATVVKNPGLSFVRYPLNLHVFLRFSEVFFYANQLHGSCITVDNVSLLCVIL